MTALQTKHLHVQEPRKSRLLLNYKFCKTINNYLVLYSICHDARILFSTSRDNWKKFREKWLSDWPKNYIHSEWLTDVSLLYLDNCACHLFWIHQKLGSERPENMFALGTKIQLFKMYFSKGRINSSISGNLVRRINRVFYPRDLRCRTDNHKLAVKWKWRYTRNNPCRYCRHLCEVLRVFCGSHYMKHQTQKTEWTFLRLCVIATKQCGKKGKRALILRWDWCYYDFQMAIRQNTYLFAGTNRPVSNDDDFLIFPVRSGSQ